MNEIQLDCVSKCFKQGDLRVEVLQQITAHFVGANTYAITGASGSGKSTLMHLIAGLDTPTNGTILFNKQSLAQFTAAQHRLFLNKSVGLVFQLPYLIGELSVLENVMTKGFINGDQTYEVLEQQARELLEQVGLADKALYAPLALSGGEQQRVAIARALFNKPAFLLADEPTGNLDINTGMNIIKLLLDCSAKWGMGVIVSSHDEYVTKKMGVELMLKDGVLEQQK